MNARYGCSIWMFRVLFIICFLLIPWNVSAQSFSLVESASWSGHDGTVTSIAISPDGQYIASGGMDHVIKLWRTDKNHELGTFRGHKGTIWAVTWSPDGQALITGGEDGAIKVWDLSSRQERQTLDISYPVLSVSVSPNRLWLAAGSGDHKVRVWNFNQFLRAEILPITTDLLSDVHFIPNSNLLALSNKTNEITLWDPAMDASAGSLQTGASPMAISPDGRWLASGTGQDESIQLWDLQRQSLVATLSGHTSLITSLDFSPDGRWLVSGSWDYSIRVWDVTQRRLSTALPEAHPIWSVAFSPDGRFLIAGEEEGVIKRWAIRGVRPSLTTSSEDTPSPFRPTIDENVDQVKVSNTQRPDALGIILGVENYRYAPDVTFARRDATIMHEYFTRILGLQENNIYIRTNRDATQGEFRKVFDPQQGWLAKRIKPGKTEVFVYYVGHGAPDVSTGEAYIMPADGDPNYPSTSYRLAELYRNLDQLKSKQTTVLLDACFSGRTGRGQDIEMLLAGARGIAVEPQQYRIGDRTIVFTASAGNQVSSSYPDKSHGLFTYFLMRGLKGEADRNGDRSITVNELYTFVREQVRTQAGHLDREQTPELLGNDDYRVLVRY